MTPEKRVQNEIMKYLTELKRHDEPIFVDRRQAGSFNYKKGIPDIYIIYYGIHIEIEVKAPGGHLSTMQEKWRDIFKKIGVIWICVENIEDLKDRLNRIKKVLTSVRTLPEFFKCSDLISDLLLLS